MPSHIRAEFFRTPRPTDNSAPVSAYPHPNLSLPHPSLSLDFRMSVALNPKISVGPTPFGHRNWISFAGGTWSGSWGTGIVLVVPKFVPASLFYILTVFSLEVKTVN